MKAIIKRELKNYLKNPLYWIACLVMMFGIWDMTSPYLSLCYYETQEELESETVASPWDRDVTEGYIRQSREKMLEEGLQAIRPALVAEDGFGMSEQEADEVLDTVRNSDMTIKEIDQYMEENYHFLGVDSFLEEYEYGRADLEETNAWIRQKLEEHPYSWYLARKFTDALSLFVGFGAAILLAFLFLRDTRRDTYELLHTKPVSAKNYVLGKAAGGYLAILLLICVSTVIFTVLGGIQAVREGVPYQPADFVIYVVLFILPNLTMIVSIYAAVALLFKNPLPAAPLLFLYMLYSNMGTETADGYQYIGRPLAIMLRFDGKFFETTVPEVAYWSQPALLAVAAGLLFLAVWIWKRRRVY